MDYGRFKQGTIIHGLRSEQYPDRECCAVIITAECDIAQCKVSKFYYLTAMDVRTWIDTDGLTYTTENKQLGKLKSFIHDFSNKIPGLLQYLNAATVDLDQIEADIRYLPPQMDTSTALREMSKIKALKGTKEETLKNLKQIISGNLTQYFFLPHNVYTTKRKEELEPKDFYEGLVVNLQDIGFFDAATVSMIEHQAMDFEKLSKPDLERYGKLFFLREKGDMIFPEEVISSPYRERLMQAFSSAFIRIGVDFDSKAAKDYWDKALQNPV